MEDDILSDIRHRQKHFLDDKREKHRRCTIDKYRGVPGEDETKKSYSQSDIVELAAKIKAKHVELSTMRTLQNALLQDEQNIISFLKVNGALHGLVKQLTETDSNKQLLAAKCCCNISLGPSKSCLILAKSASIYLITYLNSSNSHLVELCCWTLGNIIAGCEDSLKLLKDQNVTPKLCMLLSNSCDKSVMNAASYALSHYLYNHKDQLTMEESTLLNDAIQNLTDLTDEILWLLQLIVSIIPETLNSKMMLNLFREMISIVNEPNWEPKLTRLNCLIRILANGCSLWTNLVDFPFHDECFQNAISKLLSSRHKELKKETTWLLGNLYNSAPDDPAKIQFFEMMSPLLI